VNTEVRHAFRAAWLEAATHPPEGDSLAPLLNPLVDATARVAAQKLSRFSVAPVKALE
jgi:hypothetical protein